MGIFDFFKKNKESDTKNSVRSNAEPLPKVSLTQNVIDSIVQEPKKESYYKLEELKPIRMGNNFMIYPYDARWYFEAPDAETLPTIVNSDEIKRYLPGLKIETKELCRKTLENLVMRTESGMGFTYVIRERNFPIGFLIVDSPKYNEAIMHLRIWTINFFVVKIAEHKGIMHNALLRLLNHMKSIGIHNVYAIVDSTNTPCLKMMAKGPFIEIGNTNFQDENTKNKFRAFMIDLTTIRFEIR